MPYDLVVCNRTNRCKANKVCGHSVPHIPYMYGDVSCSYGMYCKIEGASNLVKCVPVQAKEDREEKEVQ